MKNKTQIRIFFFFPSIVDVFIFFFVLEKKSKGIKQIKVLLLFSYFFFLKKQKQTLLHDNSI